MFGLLFTEKSNFPIQTSTTYSLQKTQKPMKIHDNDPKYQYF